MREPLSPVADSSESEDEQDNSPTTTPGDQFQGMGTQSASNLLADQGLVSENGDGAWTPKGTDVAYRNTQSSQVDFSAEKFQNWRLSIAMHVRPQGAHTGFDIDSFPFHEMENLQFREPPMTPTTGYNFLGINGLLSARGNSRGPDVYTTASSQGRSTQESARAPAVNLNQEDDGHTWPIQHTSSPFLLRDW